MSEGAGAAADAPPTQLQATASGWDRPAGAPKHHRKQNSSRGAVWVAAQGGEHLSGPGMPHAGLHASAALGQVGGGWGGSLSMQAPTAGTTGEQGTGSPCNCCGEVVRQAAVKQFLMPRLLA